MKYLSLTLTAAIFAAISATPAVSDGVKSLRGANDLSNAAVMFDKSRIIAQDGGFKRSWKLQPPSIPHKISKEKVNLQGNDCLRCHSPENYKEEKAPKIGDSHFIDAAGKKTEKVNGRRYFCNQCHTPLNDVEPLVKNTFSAGGN